MMRNSKIGWWYIIWSKDKQNVIDGPYPDEKKAITNRSKAKKGYKARVVSFPTRNLALAAQMYKVKRLNNEN